MSTKKKTVPLAKASARGAAPMRDGWVVRHWGQEVPTYEMLNECIEILKSGKLIDAKTRLYVADVLDYLYVWLLGEDDSHRRGREPNLIMTLAAAVVHELHERHGIKIAAAASAMVRHDVGTGESRRKAQQSIERTYRKLRASGYIQRIQVNEEQVRNALTRINPRKAGNK